MALPVITHLDVSADSIVDVETILNQTIDQEIADVSMADEHTLRFTTQDGTEIDVVLPRPSSGISSGCGLTFTGSLAADVADGLVQGNGKTVSVTATSIGFTSRDATMPRIDLVVADDSTGAVTVIAGTASDTPSAPALTAGKIPLHEVWIDRNGIAYRDYVVASYTVSDPQSKAMPLEGGLIAAKAPLSRKSGVLDPSAIDLSMDVILVPTSTAVATVTIPLEDPSGKPNREWIIQDDGNASTWDIVLDAAANGGTINGANDFTISTDYQQVRLLRINGAYYVG